MPLANFIIGVYMKSLKSLLSVTALTLAISGSALANENPLATLKDVAKDNVKTTVSENVKSVKDSASAAKGNVLEKVSSTKEKVTEGVSSMKEKMAAAKDKVKSVADSAKIDINKADAKTLQQLSGIGEKKAQAIIDYRNKVGKIKDMAELSKIDGLGSTTIEKIAPFLTF